jgi:hypothetical protein
MTDVTPSPGSSSHDRMRSHRARKKYGLAPRQLLVSRSQLDALEARGYLDPDLRGNPADEVAHRAVTEIESTIAAIGRSLGL